MPDGSRAGGEGFAEWLIENEWLVEIESRDYQLESATLTRPRVNPLFNICTVPDADIDIARTNPDQRSYPQDCTARAVTNLGDA